MRFGYITKLIVMLRYLSAKQPNRSDIYLLKCERHKKETSPAEPLQNRYRRERSSGEIREEDGAFDVPRRRNQVQKSR
jgi:hypothetical protein